MKKILIIFILIFSVFLICCGERKETLPDNDPKVTDEDPNKTALDPNKGEEESDPNGNDNEPNNGDTDPKPIEGDPNGKDKDPDDGGEKDPDPTIENPNLTFNEDDFKYEIIITKCDNNYKKKITSDNYKELFDKIKDFTYQKYDQCTSCDTPLYKISYNNIIISVYEYNFFRINDELFELTSGSFDFLSKFEYVDSSSSGWLPWI